MGTNGMENWAVDLKDIAAVYPFQGYEFVFYIAGLVCWIIWHVVQLRQEAAELEREVAADRDGSHTKAWIERY